MATVFLAQEDEICTGIIGGAGVQGLEVVLN